MVSWIYKGRDDQSLQNVVGLLFRELPVAVKLSPDVTLASYFLDIQNQITQGIVHSSYPWVSLNSSPRSNDNIVINYQDMVGLEKKLPMPVKLEDIPVNGERTAESGMEFMITDADEENILISAEFSGDRFKQEDVSRFVIMTVGFLNEMIQRREKLDITLDALFKSQRCDDLFK